MHALEKHYHAILADHFFSEPAYRAAGVGRNLPNVMKCNEQPYQQLLLGRSDDAVKTLSDPVFLNAKAESGLIDDLKKDLVRLIGQIPEGDDRRILKILYSLLIRNMHLVLKRPRNTFQVLYNELRWNEEFPEGLLSKALETYLSFNKVFLRQYREPAIEKSNEILTVDQANIIHCDWSPDGKKIATGDNGGCLRVYDAEDGSELVRIGAGADDDRMYCLFSPDGRSICSITDRSVMKLWDAVSGTLSVDFCEGHSGAVGILALSPDCEKLVSIGDDDMLIVWDLRTGKSERRTREKDLGLTGQCCFSRDGRRFISGNGGLHVRDSGTWRKRKTIDSGYVVSFDVSSDGKTAVAIVTPGGPDRSLVLWDLESGKEIRRIVEHRPELSKCLFSPDGLRFAASIGTVLVIWDVLSSDPIFTCEGHTGLVRDFRFSPDGTGILSAGRDRSLRFRDIETGSVLRTIDHSSGILECLFSNDGGRVVFSGEDLSLTILDVPTGRVIRNLKRHSKTIKRICFSPDGGRVLSAGADGILCLWDADSGDLLTIFSGHTGAVRDCLFSHDGKTVISAGSDRTVRIWDASSGVQIDMLFKGHNDLITGCRFSPDGSRIATTAKDGLLKLWDARDGGEILSVDIRAAFGGHKFCFLSGRELLAAVNGEGVLRFDGENGRLLGSFYEDYSGRKLFCAVSGDGSSVIVSDEETWVGKFDRTGTELASMGEFGDSVFHLSPNHDGSKIILFNRNGISSRDFESGETVRIESALTIFSDLAVNRDSVLSNDGRRMISRKGNETVIVRDADTGGEAMSLNSKKFDGRFSCGFSRDGRFLAIAFEDVLKVFSIDGFKNRPYYRIGSEGRHPFDYYFTRESFRFFDGDRLIVTHDSDGNRIWDSETAGEVARPDGNYAFFDISDERRRIIARTDFTFEILAAADFKPILSRKSNVPYPLTRNCSFTPDGRRIIEITGNSVNVLDAGSGEGIRLIPLLTRTDLLRFTPNDDQVISISTVRYEPTLKVWDAESGNLIENMYGQFDENTCETGGSFEKLPTVKFHRILAELNGRYRNDFHLVRNGSKWADGCFYARSGIVKAEIRQKTIRISDADTDTQFHTINSDVFSGSSPSIHWCDFSPDAGRIAIACDPSDLIIWDLETDAVLARLSGHSGQVKICGYSRDGRRIFSGGMDGTLKIWDAESGREILSLNLGGTIVDAGFSPDGGKILTVCGDYGLRILDAGSGSIITAIETGFKDRVTVCRFSNRGDKVIASDGNSIRIWNAETGRELLDLTEHHQFLTREDDFHLSLCGKHVFILGPTGSDDHAYGSRLNVRDLEKCETVSEPILCMGRGLRVFPDERSFAVLNDTEKNYGESIRIWNLKPGEVRGELNHGESIRKYAISPDGRKIVSVSRNRIRAWEVASGKPLFDDRSPETDDRDFTHTIIFFPDGNHFSVNCRGPEIKVYDIRTPGLTASHLGDYRIDGCAVSGSGDRIVCGDNDRNLYFFSLEGLKLPFRIVTGSRIWNYASDPQDEGRWDDRTTFFCPFCLRRMPVPSGVLDAVAEVYGNCRIGNDDSPCLTLPDEAWEVPRLFSECPDCHGKLKFNPFFVGGPGGYRL